MGAITTVPAHVPADRVFDFDAFNDEQLRENLHAAYARLHREAPDIFYTPQHGGHWMVTRHEAIASIVMDPEHFSASEMHIPRIPNPTKLIPLNLDPPESIPYRQILMPFFAPRSIAAMTENIHAHAKNIIAAVAINGKCDFVDAVASRFPVTVFMELMGFPLERLEDFRTLADQYFKARDPQDIHRLVNQITSELVGLIELRKREPKNDLITHLITAKIKDRELGLEELVPMCMLLFFGGLDTVTNAMSFSARFLAQNPSIQQRLIDDPAAIEAYVEESVRMFGVVNTPRLVVKDCERFGVTFRAGDMVLCNLPLAGWDDKKNPNPEIFDIDRQNRSHLIFSTGPHLCLGHFLARMEMRTVFSEWAKQIGHFNMAENFQPHYRPGMVMALESLQLEWSPKAG